MGKLFQLIVNQKKREIRKTKSNNYNNNERKNICHACKTPISEYETFYFINVPYCDLCYVLLAYTL